MIEVRAAGSTEEMKDVYRVRNEVFVQEQGVPEAIEVDEKEKEAVHFVLYDGSEALGAARLRFHGTSGKAERVCVLKSKRGSGMGHKLMQEMESYAKAEGAESLKLNSQLHAAPFYTKIGYRIISKEPFLEAGIEHVTMEKFL